MTKTLMEALRVNLMPTTASVAELAKNRIKKRAGDVAKTMGAAVARSVVPGAGELMGRHSAKAVVAAANAEKSSRVSLNKLVARGMNKVNSFRPPTAAD